MRIMCRTTPEPEGCRQAGGTRASIRADPALIWLKSSENAFSGIPLKPFRLGPGRPPPR